MMRMRINLLALQLFLLMVVSADELSLSSHVPIINETFGLIEEYQGIINASSVMYEYKECGMQGGGRKCPTGQCCSMVGWCGTSSDYCAPENCQSQCPQPFPQGRCGWQAGGGKCPKGVCCSYSGWCGTTSNYCDPNYCQSQCSGPFPQGKCGWQADGTLCPTGMCCGVIGWCGNTWNYCASGNCQSQCENALNNESF